MYRKTHCIINSRLYEVERCGDGAGVLHQRRYVSIHPSIYLESTLNLALTRYCYYQYCMVYSIDTGGRKGSRTPSNNRAIILHQGGQCRWARGMKHGWFVDNSLNVNEYLVQANPQPLFLGGWRRCWFGSKKIVSAPPRQLPSRSPSSDPPSTSPSFSAGWPCFLTRSTYRYVSVFFFMQRHMSRILSISRVELRQKKHNSNRRKHESIHFLFCVLLPRDGRPLRLGARAGIISSSDPLEASVPILFISRIEPQ